MLPDRNMVVIDSLGLSEGMVALWNLRWVKFKAYRCFIGILLLGRLRGLVGRFHILNLYALHRYQSTSWDRLEAADILKIRSLIVVGDFNAIIVQEECWGSTCRMDPLAGKLNFFCMIIT